ncbi:MAG: phosphonate metabolism protein/1,5-bisphosphokinase (PRPP-forming) PhnN [Roseovarius sp.]|nr:phosphonate metabolism protein/1,5-bisphosphokinase (PRPP-forming) PhnN [Roseovarius sp.]
MIAIVGQSGVGKDTVMAALRARCPEMAQVRRTITRPCDETGEEHFATSDCAFSLAKSREEFILDWEAHGLSYGISHCSVAPLLSGRDMLINLSRGTLEAADSVFDRFIVINLIAPRAVLRKRLKRRGRENLDEMAERLDRKMPQLPGSLKSHEVSNDRDVRETVDEILDILLKESRCHVTKK